MEGVISSEPFIDHYGIGVPNGEPVVPGAPDPDLDLDGSRTAAWIAGVRRHVRQDRDYWIGVTGRPGAGKSTLSRHLGRALDGSFNYQRMGMSGEHFLDIADACPRFGAFVADESISGFFSREHATGENRAAQRWSWIMRGRNLITIVNLNELRWGDPMLLARLNCVWDIPYVGGGLARIYFPQRVTSMGGLWLESVNWVPQWALEFGPIPDSDPDSLGYLRIKRQRMYETDVRRPKTPKVVATNGSSQKNGDGGDSRVGRGVKPCIFDGSVNRVGKTRARVAGAQVRICYPCRERLYRYRLNHGRNSAPPDMVKIVKSLNGGMR